VKTVRVERWADFVACTDELQGWAFRGHLSIEWPLMSSLSRRLVQFCPDRRLWPLREARAMRVFRRKAHIHLSDRSVLDDDLRCLALMQHHGGVTRLLDFTKSPFVAAFFALESAASEVAVFALNTPALWNCVPDFDPSLMRSTIDPRVQGNFERYFASNKLPVLWFGEPSEMDARLVAQSGLFVLPGKLDQPIEEILRHYGSADDLLTMFLLAPSMREDAMQSLYRMNVTYATLFPDLDGLARSVSYELEAIWGRLIEDYERDNA
jgi:hypothetical protein